MTSTWTHSIDRTILLNSARTSSLLFTRCLISRLTDTTFNFSPFSQLSHLSLWGPNRLNIEPNGPNQAREIVMLPLEELIVLDWSDNNALLHELTANVTIWQTLQRFTGFSDERSPRPDGGWLKCPNLTQVLILCYGVGSFIDTSIKSVILPSSPKFQSYMISPDEGWDMSTPPRDQLTLLIKDSRIVILRKCPQHFGKYSRSFWDNQSAMWAIAQKVIRKNLQVEVSFPYLLISPYEQWLTTCDHRRRRSSINFPGIRLTAAILSRRS
jgi:hypothetical protein